MSTPPVRIPVGGIDAIDWLVESAELPSEAKLELWRVVFDIFPKEYWQQNTVRLRVQEEELVSSTVTFKWDFGRFSAEEVDVDLQTAADLFFGRYNELVKRYNPPT